VEDERMMSASVLRARFARLLGAALMLAGAAGLACFVVLLMRHFGALSNEFVEAGARQVDGLLLALTPPLEPTWNTGVNVAVAFGVTGLALVALGALLRELQRPRFELARRAREDRLRRVHLYRQAGRREPYIGPGIDAHKDDEDHPRRRRVA
jgi:hypothetical protein